MTLLCRSRPLMVSVEALHHPAPGFRLSHREELQHYRTIAALPLILGKQREGDADYLEVCRRKRNITEYDRAGSATTEDASELVVFAKELRTEVLAWLKQHHPDLVPK
jgi:hypothetical protein